MILFRFNKIYKMSEYNRLNVKLSNWQLNKLKSAIKIWTEVTLNPSSNLIGNCSYEISFPHILLLTDTQVSKICKTFANGSSANIKFSKNQLSKLRYFNFEPNFKLQWCHVRDLFGSQTPVTWPQEGLNYESLAYKLVA